MPNYEISEAQWRVMEVVWSRGEATAAEVIDALTPSTNWNHQTVRTLLTRLVQKGVLQTRPVRNYYIYSPLVSREKSVRAEGKSFLQRLFHGNTDALLVHFVREGKVTQETLDRLQELIDKEQKNAKQKTPKQRRKNDDQ
ncbi:MAG: BlaI/MecI/CopY family transcriptional regulator [Planctomycetaceae bacterium]|jgi:BlaI family penicillinase repressor|nr:BlaI/MecI/CopY family transcriptional regulator [Planctomycetaceae bacterium]